MTVPKNFASFRFSLRTLLLAVLSIGAGGVLVLANARPTWATHFEIRGDAHRFGHAAFSADARWIIAEDRGCVVSARQVQSNFAIEAYRSGFSIFNAATGTQTGFIETTDYQWDLAADECALLSWTAANELHYWSLPDGNLLRTVKFAGIHAESEVVIAPDTSWAALRIPNGGIALARLPGGEIVSRIECAHDAWCKFAPDSRTLLVGSFENTRRNLELFEVESGRKTASFDAYAGCAADFSANGEQVLCVLDHDKTAVCDVKTGALLHTRDERVGDLRQRTKTSNDGRQLVDYLCRHELDEIQVWDATSGGAGQPLESVYTASSYYSSVHTESRFNHCGDRIVAVLDGTAAPDICVFHRLRPEWWWGIFWLPEFWLVAALAASVLFSLRRDRVLYPAPAAKSDITAPAPALTAARQGA